MNRRLSAVAVYEYSAIRRDNNRIEEGTVVARNVLHAKDLLAKAGLGTPRLKQLKGVQGFLRQLSADIR